ncbi:SIR2 family protein, partial [Pantoea ananatis]
SIIITKNDYDKFNTKNELIRAQLLSLFIHNPIIFIGYSISDSNIKNVLRTIFSYIPKETDVADEIRKNFLLIERYENINATDVITHDIDIEGIGIIKINKVITDDFSSIYRAIGELKLPVSVMDIRRVEDVFRKIKEGGDIKVKLVGDLDSLSNDELVLAVGSVKIIKYHFQTLSEMMENYFDIIDESNKELVE